MKKLLLLLSMLICGSLAAHAQGAIKYPISDPTGTACGGYDFALYQGKLYTCTAGVFAVMPVTPSGNANFVLYPSSSPSGNACSATNNIDPLAQVFAGTVYTCQAGAYTAVAGSGGGGNVSNSGTPLANQYGVWTDATHMKGIAISGDCTASGLGAWTCTKTNNVSFAASATTDTTNAANIGSGTLPAGRLPNPSASTLGGVESLAATTHQFLTSISTLGVPVGAQPACADLSDAAASCNVDATNASNIGTGTINNARLPSSISISGSITASSFAGTGNAFAGTEAASSTIACATTQDIFWADSVSHRWKFCNNNATADTVAGLADFANQVTAASAASAANQVCVASGASKTCTYIDFPDTKIIPLSAAPAGTASAGVSYATGQWTPTARAGTNNIGAALQAIPSTGATLQFRFKLAGDWDTASQPFIAFDYASGANTSGTVIFTVSSACTKADGSVTDDPAFVAESAFGTQTMAVAARDWGQSGQFTAINSGNNCIVGSPVIVKVVLSGTAASAINLYQISMTTPRKLQVQAN